MNLSPTDRMDQPEDANPMQRAEMAAGPSIDRGWRPGLLFPLLLLGIVLVGVALRGWNLEAKSLWFDESLSLAISDRPSLADVVDRCKAAMHGRNSEMGVVERAGIEEGQGREAELRSRRRNVETGGAGR